MSGGACRALVAAMVMVCAAGPAHAQEDAARADAAQEVTRAAQAGSPQAHGPRADTVQENAAQVGAVPDGEAAGAQVLAPDDGALSERTLVRFLAGGALGLGLHEGGHLLFDVALGAGAGVRGVSFGPVPFFAITHRDVSPVREFTISSAGFWMQHASTEWLLTRRPRLRAERAPAMKGLLAFNLLASAAYGAAAIGKLGPAERDTRGMADQLRMDEAWVGAMVLAPAALDTWRYFRPDSATARWSSRAAKLAMVLLVVRAASR